MRSYFERLAACIAVAVLAVSSACPVAAGEPFDLTTGFVGVSRDGKYGFTTVRKIGYVDLLKIADPDNRKRQGGGDGYYDMPFVTIENVDRVDGTHIVVGNDNNLPFSAGRALDKAGDNEFVLLEVGEFLKAE